MAPYEKSILEEFSEWKQRMKRKPSFTNELAKKLQIRINRVIPEKVHKAITTAIKQMTRAVCLGAEFTTPEPLQQESLENRELRVHERIKFYTRTATAEGAITG